MHVKLVAAALSILALGATAAADEVVTKAGASYAGKIVAEDEQSVTVDSPALGRLRIARSEIASMKRDAESPPAEPAPDAPPADSTEPSEGGKEPAEGAAPAETKPETKAADEEASLSAEERDARRRASRIKRRTEPTKTAAAPKPPAEDEAKATLGGAQLAKTERGSWIVVFQPPRQFEAAPGGIQIGRRVYARLESVGSASAWLAVPMASGEENVPIRLSEVQRHASVRTGAPRIVRMIEGIDRGSWLRVRLADGTYVQGTLQGLQEGALTLGSLGADGQPVTATVADDKIVEVDGLMRSTATRLTLAETTEGEAVALTLWPDGREVVGMLRARTESSVTISTVDGVVETIAVDGPIAEARRVPARWRPIVAGFGPTSVVHVRSVDEYSDARVERDLVGFVLGTTPHAITVDSADGVVVVPFDTVHSLEALEEEDRERLAAKPRKKSERACHVPVLPGEPAAKAAGLDLAKGVVAVTDGTTVQHVLVARPFEGEVYGIRLGDTGAGVSEQTDLRFDTMVLPHRVPGAEERPMEMTSNSLASVRVTLLLDATGSVSAIELGAR